MMGRSTFSAKGITPVIAIVLLLLVTVGAVGVVYTQFNSLVGNPAEQTEFLDSVDVKMHGANRIEATNNQLRIDTDGDGTTEEKAPETVQIRFENTMDQEFVLNESLRMEYSIPGESRVEPTFSQNSNVTEIFGEYTVVDLANVSQFDQCLSDVSVDQNGDDYFFSSGETIQCNTGVEMPQPTDPLTIHLVEEGSGEVAAEYTCNPSSTDSYTC